MVEILNKHSTAPKNSAKNTEITEKAKVINKPLKKSGAQSLNTLQTVALQTGLTFKS